MLISATDPHITAIESPLDANVWKIAVAENEVLEPEQVICVLEAMKMEVPIRVPVNAGRVEVRKICTTPADSVQAGSKLVLLQRI